MKDKELYQAFDSFSVYTYTYILHHTDSSRFINHKQADAELSASHEWSCRSILQTINQ